MIEYDIIEDIFLATIVGGQGQPAPGYQAPQDICQQSGVSTSTQAHGGGSVPIGPVRVPMPFNFGFQQVNCNPPAGTQQPQPTPTPQPSA